MNKFKSLKERAEYCLSTKNPTCFISLKELASEDVIMEYHLETELLVPIHKKYMQK